MPSLTIVPHPKADTICYEYDQGRLVLSFKKSRTLAEGLLKLAIELEELIKNGVIGSTSYDPRNSPCPCKSGLKYKECCISKQKLQVCLVIDNIDRTVVVQFPDGWIGLSPSDARAVHKRILELLP